MLNMAADQGEKKKKTKQASKHFFNSLCIPPEFIKGWDLLAFSSRDFFFPRESHVIKTKNCINHKIGHRNFNNDMHLPEV